MVGLALDACADLGIDAEEMDKARDEAEAADVEMSKIAAVRQKARRMRAVARLAVAAAGTLIGMDDVLKATRRHTSDLEVRRKGLSALGKPARNAGDQVKIAPLTGMDVVLEATRRRTSELEVRRTGLAALGYLARNAGNQVKIA